MNRNKLFLLILIILFTGCGGEDSTSSQNDGKGDIDMVEYLPSKSFTKTFMSIDRNGDEVQTMHYDEIVTFGQNKITTVKDSKLIEEILFTDISINTTSFVEEEKRVYSMHRHVDLGDKLFLKHLLSTEITDLGKVSQDITQTCTLKSKEERFEKNDNIYVGDLLKVECIAEGQIVYDVKPSLLAHVTPDLNGSHEYVNISYYYLQKDLGKVAEIDDNCIVDETLSEIINDKKSTADCSTVKHYNYTFYLP